MPISSMSMTKALPSQCSRLGPMASSFALRDTLARLRSVMVQRRPAWPYKATFTAQWFSAAVAGLRARAQA